MPSANLGGLAAVLPSCQAKAAKKNTKISHHVKVESLSDSNELISTAYSNQENSINQPCKKKPFKNLSKPNRNLKNLEQKMRKENYRFISTEAFSHYYE